MIRSTRNIPSADVRVIDELNAFEVLRRRKLIFTKPAFERLLRNPVAAQSEDGAA